jgi:hypothetical protein
VRADPCTPIALATHRWAHGQSIEGVTRSWKTEEEKLELVSKKRWMDFRMFELSKGSSITCDLRLLLHRILVSRDQFSQSSTVLIAVRYIETHNLK